MTVLEVLDKDEDGGLVLVGCAAATVVLLVTKVLGPPVGRDIVGRLVARVGDGVDRDDSDRDDEELALEDVVELAELVEVVVGAAAELEEVLEETTGVLRLEISELEGGSGEAADDTTEEDAPVRVGRTWGERFLMKRLRVSWSRR